MSGWWVREWSFYLRQAEMRIRLFVGGLLAGAGLHFVLEGSEVGTVLYGLGSAFVVLSVSRRKR